MLLYICLVLPAFGLLAQTHYNLQKLITASENYLPVLKQKQALINSAKASVTDIRHSFLPQLNLSDQLNIGTDNSLAGTLLPIGINPSTSGGVRASGNMQLVGGNLGVLYGEYELVNFGLNTAKIKTAEAVVGLQKSDLEREKYLIQLQVSKLYFTALKTSYRLETDKQNVKRYDSIFKVIKALTLSGLRAGSDSSLAKAELSKARITYNQTLGNLNQIKEQLAYYTGVPASQLVIDHLASSFDNQLPLQINRIPDTTGNPLIEYYLRKKDILLSNNNLIRKTYQPKILLAASTWARGSSIQYNDDYKSLGTGLGYQRLNYSVGIALTYNLFNGIYRKDKLTINHFETEASDFELQQERLALSTASLQADNVLLTTKANLAELPVQLKSAEDTYQQKLAQYKAGIISLIDLTNASFVLYRSQTDYIETLNDWYLAQLDKAVATGNLIQFIQTIK